MQYGSVFEPRKRGTGPARGRIRRNVFDQGRAAGEDRGVSPQVSTIDSESFMLTPVRRNFQDKDADVMRTQFCAQVIGT